MYLNQLSIRPPLHPLATLSHSTSSSSLKDSSLPLAIAFAPSTEPVVENAQHEPHWPWFFTGVTAPLATQSTESARLVVSKTLTGLCVLVKILVKSQCPTLTQ